MARLTGTTPPARLAVLVAALALVAAALFSPAIARAEGTVDTWDGTADTTWYDASSPQAEYTITTAEQLAGLAELVNAHSDNDFLGTTIILGADIDLGGHEWTPIGDTGNVRVFRGTLVGGGHAISNLTITDSKVAASHGAGFFGMLGGTIDGVRFEDVQISFDYTGAFYIGGIAAASTSGTAEEPSSGIIRNCSISGTITTATDYMQLIGSVVAHPTGGTQIIGCTSSVEITSTSEELDGGEAIGGIAGQWDLAQPSALIADCSFTGSVTTSATGSTAAGILAFGSAGNSSTGPGLPIIKNCFSTSLPTVTSDTSYAAAIAFVFPTVSGTVNVTSCLWPTSANSQAVGVVDTDTYAIGFSSDTAPYGSAVSDFSDPALVAKLNENDVANPDGDTWRVGIGGHPVLWWQSSLIAADYSAVDAALARVPADLSLYTAESAAAVETARDAVDRTLAADRQAEVDAMAEAIEDAVAALEKLADYDAVDAAVAKAEALDRTLYAEDSLAALDEAVADVTRGYGETRQAEVDSMAEAIESALAALEYLPADYSAVDAALAKVPEDLSGYTDESAAALERAVAAVERELDVTEQDRVDAMAEAIEAALDALEEVPAPKPEQDADDKDNLPAAGDPTVLLAPAFALTGGAVLLARRRVA